ncbi:MAG: LuxR C-terminal-related transcriptional regulator [Chromatocurvus sp.]
MKRQLAHFRHVACLGFAPQTALVALLDALHSIIPSNFNRFGFCDREFRVTNAYSENAALYRFFEYYFSEIDGKVDYWPTVSECLRRGLGVGYYLPYQTAAFYRSSYYHEVERDLGAYHQLDGTIADRHRVYGNLVMARERAHAFTSAEQRLLASLLPYFAHALAAPPHLAAGVREQNRELAVTIFDSAGNLHSADAAGIRALWMINHQDVAASDIVSKSIAHSALVARLAAQLIAIEREQVVPPPSTTVRNAWGSFVLRAERMFGAAGDASLFRILIERRQPGLLALLQRMHQLNLTPRQQDVCRLLVGGKTQREIGTQLGIRRTTVNEYVQTIYAKLGIRSHHELVQSMGLMNLD